MASNPKLKEVARLVVKARPDLSHLRSTTNAREFLVQACNAIDAPPAGRKKKHSGFLTKFRRGTKPFYESREWMQLRYAVLKRDGAKCALCCSTRADGVRLHVDHIKPRSVFPELELDPENLQVLCEPCNLGKSNLDQTDWREGRALDS